MRALEPEVFDAVWAAVEPLLPSPTRPTRWAVTDGGRRTASASRPC